MAEKLSNPKDLIGSTKPPLSTVPCNVLMELGAAMLEGTKYGRHNYRVVGVRASIYYDALQRHIMAWWEGEDADPDSGVSHIIKAMACLTVLRDAEQQQMLNDDRPPRSKPWMPDLQAKVDGVLKRVTDPLPPYTQKNHGSEEEEAEVDSDGHLPEGTRLGKSTAGRILFANGSGGAVYGNGDPYSGAVWPH